MAMFPPFSLLSSLCLCVSVSLWFKPLRSDPVLYRISVLCPLFLLTFSLAAAQETPKAPLKDILFETQHSVKLNGDKLHYTVTAGTMVLKEEDGKALASIFFVAYTKNAVDDLARRPITFTFNGGPGSSSVWLHMGAFAPKKVLLDDDGNAYPPHYKLIDNPYT